MAFPTGWNYKRQISIDTGQKSGSPTGIVLTITESSGLADANGPLDADGTAPAQNGGGDLRVSSDAAGTVQIPLDVVSFVTDNNHAAATCELKVNFDDLSSDALYLWWGTAGTDSQPAVTDTYGRNAVYSSGSHAAVYTLHEDPAGSSPQFTDRTGNGNNGTSNGSMTSGDVVTGKVGNGVDLEGTDDYISVPDSTGFDVSSLTVSCWMKYDDEPSAASYPLSKGTLNGDSTSEWALYYNQGVDRFRFFVISTTNSLGIVTANTYGATAPGTWYHVVGTFDGTAVKVYVNGQSDSASFSASLKQGTNGVTLGRAPGNSAWYLDGVLDETRIYGRALSGDDVTTQYNCESNNAAFWSVGSVQSTGGTPAGFSARHYYQHLMSGA